MRGRGDASPSLTVSPNQAVPGRGPGVGARGERAIFSPGSRSSRARWRSHYGKDDVGGVRDTVIHGLLGRD